jgi:macrolide-specific efflux system membrane fusion protein
MKSFFSIFRKRWVRATLVCLAAVAAGYYWLSKPAKPSYQTVVIGYGDIAENVVSSGVLQPLLKVDVGAQVSGQLQKLHVQLGKTVKKGDLLATIDPSIAKNDLLNLEAALEQQAAQRDAKQIDLEQAKRELIRQNTMLQSEATAKLDAEQADSTVRKIQADMRSLAAQIRQTKIGVDTARTKLGYTQITAPVDGDVVNITTQEGQTVIAVQQVPIIMTIAKLDTMMVKAQVSEADVVSLHPGQAVYFTTLGQSEERHFGKLRTIQPTPENVNGAIFYNALFDVPNPKRDLWTNMTVQVSFVLNEAKHVLTVPVIALGEKDKNGRYAVKVLNKDDTVSKRKVSIALNDHINAQIKEGLAAGERVIIGDQAKSEKAESGAGS